MDIQKGIARGLDRYRVNRWLRDIREALDTYRRRERPHSILLVEPWDELDQWLSAGAVLPAHWQYRHPSQGWEEPDYDPTRWPVITDPTEELTIIRQLIKANPEPGYLPDPGNLAERIAALDRWMVEHKGMWPDQWAVRSRAEKTD